MSNESPLLRGSAIRIRLAYFLFFVLLFFPIQSPGEPLCLGWQGLFFVCNPSQSDLMNYYLPNIMSYVAKALIELLVFLWPPLASMAVFHPRWRTIGIVGLWISLPLTLGPCLICIAGVFDPFNGAGLLFRVLTSTSGFCFALSFIACFVLALRLPLICPREQTGLPVSRALHGAGQHEEAEQMASTSGVDHPAPAAGSGQRLLLAFIGLLCHLAIGLSLFFTYTDTYDPYGSTTSPDDTTTFTTGWQLLGKAFQGGVLLALVAVVLLAALVLPMLIYLSQLLFFLWRRERDAMRLFSSLSLSRVLNSIGLSLSGVLLMFSLIFRGGDLHDPVSCTGYLAHPFAKLLTSPSPLLYLLST